MNERDQNGFVTLHTGYPPIVQRLAWVFIVAVDVIYLWGFR